jgi:hypothetical protein
MTYAATVSRLTRVLLISVLLAFGAADLYAQAAIILSKNADFSTDDRVFDRTDVLYVQVTALQIDFNDLDKNEFRLKPDEGGNDIEGAFTNHSDGTYTTSVDLSTTDPTEADWEWRARIEDDNDNEFEARINITIGTEEDDDDNGEDDEVEFTGTIDDIQSDGLTVEGTFFFVTATTSIRDNDDNPITFADLAVGMLVEIRGERDANGDLIATDIEIEDGDDDEVEITGEIEAIGASSVTVGGSVFVVTDQTLLLDNNNNPIAFSAFAVGMLVEAEGDVQPDGTISARKIKMEDRADDEVELRGTIESLGTDTIMVEGITFAVNAQTMVLDNDNNPMAFGDLSTGQFVEIEGDIQADGTLVARKIKLEDDDQATVETTGSISRLTSNQVVVSDITFLVDQATEVVDANNQPLDRSALTTGQHASVRGTTVTALLVATRIKLHDVTASPTAIEEADVPTSIKLYQNYPNPFNPTTTISFSLSGAAAPVSLTIYNVLGQQVATLVDGVLPAGAHAYTWDTQHAASSSGLYLYRLQVGQQVLTRQMMLLK